MHIWCYMAFSIERFRPVQLCRSQEFGGHPLIMGMSSYPVVVRAQQISLDIPRSRKLLYYDCGFIYRVHTCMYSHVHGLESYDLNHTIQLTGYNTTHNSRLISLLRIYQWGGGAFLQLLISSFRFPTFWYWVHAL